MNKNTFDDILKQNVVNVTGFDFFGPNIYNGTFPNYYNCCAFDEFVTQMQTVYRQHYEKYSSGKGSELLPKDGKPPKMSSVASSSRFCYLSLRNVANVDFEHACPIKGIKGTPPQMDAYIAGANIFIEVKCHEIFDKHKKTLSKQYFSLLFGEKNDFGLENIAKNELSEHGIKENGNEFEIPFDRLKMGKEPSMMDFKQFVCHLLGVKSHKKESEEATLVYLFFKPKALLKEQNDEINTVFDDLQAEIRDLFDNEHIKKFIGKNNIKLKAVAQYSEVMSPLTKENMIVLYP